ncbi:MAG TPA: hypothetical protein VET23_04645 [Chitinophagaceae bacterium]|nr:hypothetical protein [Chitinophagaceae bacterium]
MKQYIANIAWVVEDDDEAINFYTEKLSFPLKEDTKLTETKRRVLVAQRFNRMLFVSGKSCRRRLKMQDRKSNRRQGVPFPSYG